LPQNGLDIPVTPALPMLTWLAHLYVVRTRAKSCAPSRYRFD